MKTSKLFLREVKCSGDWSSLLDRLPGWKKTNDNVYSDGDGTFVYFPPRSVEHAYLNGSRLSQFLVRKKNIYLLFKCFDHLFF